MANKLNNSEINKSNPIRLLDLNNYPLSDEQINNPQLRKWTKEIISQFTKSGLYNKEYKNTVKKNVYNLPLNKKLSKYGARHFIMKEQCQLSPKEIDELRAEAKDIHSPYWYGMISTCHHSGHITLKIAKMLFPTVNWKLVKTPGHSFVINISDDKIKKLFGNDYTLYNLSKIDKNVYLNAVKERVSELEKIMIDKAKFDESAPMIIDILVTEKKMFLDLAAYTPKNYIHIIKNSPENIRKYSTNVEQIPITTIVKESLMKIKNQIYNTFTMKNNNKKNYNKKNNTRRMNIEKELNPFLTYL